MNAIYIRHVALITCSTCRVASPPFTNPLPWPHGIVKCPSDTHFIITPNTVVNHMDIFCLHFEFILIFNYVGRYAIVNAAEASDMSKRHLYTCLKSCVKSNAA